MKYFRIIFKNQNPLYLAKDLTRATQAKNEQLVNNVNDGLIYLRNAIIRKEFLENENPTKIIDIVGNSSTLINNKKKKELKYYFVMKCFKDYQYHLHK